MHHKCFQSSDKDGGHHLGRIWILVKLSLYYLLTDDVFEQYVKH